MRRMHGTACVRLLALPCALLLGSISAAAQTAPPIQGVTGTVATDGTINSEHRAAHAIAEGAGRVVDHAKKALSLGGNGTDQNPLDGFSEGRRVVLRDVAHGDGAPADRVDAGSDDLKTTEGVVIDVNRRRKQITVRFADRRTQTLRLAAPDTTPNVVVSYTDDAGARVARDFTRVS